MFGIAPERIPLPKDELLHKLRGLQEADHLDKLFKYSAFSGWLCFPDHKALDLGSLSGMRIEDANGACNRTAPVFIMSGEAEAANTRNYMSAMADMSVMETFLAELLRYTYQRWFRPYRSEVDRGQFLTKVSMVPGTLVPPKTCLENMVDHVRTWSANLCARAEDTRSREVGVDERHAGKRLYSMRPLFRAVAVAIRASDYTLETQISTMPVLIVRTGIEDGLSETINLGMIAERDRVNSVMDQSGNILAVDTTLEVAITYLIALEQREAAAVGQAPDSEQDTVFMTNGWVDVAADAAADLGWDTDTMGQLQGPSSTWVDEEKYTEWSGNGYESMLRFEQNCKRCRERAKHRVAETLESRLSQVEKSISDA